jgi:hypothetical protein
LIDHYETIAHVRKIFENNWQRRGGFEPPALSRAGRPALELYFLAQLPLGANAEAALLDRLTHHVHILELNGESYRLKQSKARRRRDPRPADEVAAAVDPETGEITRAS